MLKVLIADDHPVMREGLKRVIAQTQDITVVAEASDGQEVLDKHRRVHADLIVLDISMPGRNGLDILKQLRTQYPRLPVLVLSQHSEDEYAIRALRAGASGYLTKQSASLELIQALRKIASGGKYMSETLAEKLAGEISVKSEKSPHELLSDREYEVLCLMGSGKRVSDIAVELSLSVKTISTYRSRILEKMSLGSTAELIRYVIERRLLESENSRQSVDV